MKPTRLNIELPTRKLNRIASKTPKSIGLFWCGKCDRNMIGLGEKCGVCGNKPPHKYFKKQDLT